MMPLAVQDALVPIVIIPIALMIMVLMMVWHFRRSAIILNRWAERNGFRVVSKEYRWMVRGPFWWRTSNGQSVYRVEVVDAQGEFRRGYVRVGGWFLGLFSDAAHVEWDKPDATHGPPGFPVVMHNDDDRDDHERAGHA